jgi:hypothetical protein
MTLLSVFTIQLPEQKTQQWHGSKYSIQDTISEISKSILKFLANPMVIQLKSYHLPIDLAELSSGTAQS